MLIGFACVSMTSHAYASNVIRFCSHFFFFRTSSKVTEQNSAKPCHMFGSETDLKIIVKKFGGPLSLKYGPKMSIFAWFYDDV